MPPKRVYEELTAWTPNLCSSLHCVEAEAGTPGDTKAVVKFLLHRRSPLDRNHLFAFVCDVILHGGADLKRTFVSSRHMPPSPPTTRILLIINVVF
jgi:hypothetical protein